MLPRELRQELFGAVGCRQGVALRSPGSVGQDQIHPYLSRRCMLSTSPWQDP